MRVVLDTNVLVRSTPASVGGPAADLLKRIADRGDAILLSAPMIAELADVLRRPRFRVAIGLTSEQATEFLNEITQAAELVEISTMPAIEALRDAKDAPILLTAISGRADVICTRDRHLMNSAILSLCKPHGIRVLSDTELLDEMLRE
jgi:uncharacterized protein